MAKEAQLNGTTFHVGDKVKVLTKNSRRRQN